MKFQKYLNEGVAQKDDLRTMAHYADVNMRGMGRKVSDLKDVPDVSRTQLKKLFPKAFASLKRMSSGDLFKTDFNLLDKFSGRKPPQVFIMKHGRAEYLVNTEGYDYMRYIGKLK